MKASKTTTRAKARWTTAQKAEARKGRGAAPGRGSGTTPREGAKRYAASGAPFRSRRPDGPGTGSTATDRRRPGPRPERTEEFPRYRGRQDGPRYRRDDAQGERGADRGASGRDRRDTAPSYRRDDAPRYGAGPKRYDRDDRPRYGAGANRYDRGDGPRSDRRDEAPRYDRRDDRPRYDKARYDRRDEAPRYDRRDEAPRYDRRDEAPRYDRRDDRPRYGRDDKPRDERRDAAGGYDRPRYARDDKPRYERRNEEPRTVRDEPRRDARWERQGHDRPRELRPDGRAARRPDRRPDPRADRMRRQEPVRRDIPDRGPLADAAVPADNPFLTLGVPDVLVRRLARDGITEPFPIQAATIPDALAGRDVLGRGRTGSGKTLAFGLPTLARLAAGQPASPKRPKALVLVPTRELAIQVSDALEPLAHVAGVRHKLVAGGLAYATQFAALERGVDLLIATPGRLIDLVDRGAVALDQVEVAILDEADHMADMGFLPDVTTLLDMIPPGGQRLLFSATLDKGIDELVERYLTDPVEHATDAATASVTTMAHHVLLVEPTHKKLVTAQVANRDGRTIVFVRTKLGADRVAREIREQGVLAAALHGGLNQGARNRVLAAFRDGRMPVLVATDVAARGIHVDDVSVVLQVDPPMDGKDYLHRAGRTARAGEPGTVVTLALPHQRRTVERLVAAAGVDVTAVPAGPGDEALLAATGARRTTGIPVPEEAYLRIVEPPQRRRPQRRPDASGRRPAREGDRRRMKGREAG